MKALTSILAATDFSEHARAAVERAAHLAKEQEAPRRIDRLMTECLPQVPQSTYLIERGDPSPVILAQAQAQSADLIILGKQGRSRAEELFLGSVTRHILAGSTCDVLVVSP